MRRLLFATFALLSVVGVAVLTLGCRNSTAQDNTKRPEAQPAARDVKGQVLTSKVMPTARLEFDKAFKYAGNQSFVLYEVANAEQHFFVDADKDGRIKRLYWIQFEGYLPSNDHTYDYKSTKSVNIGGFDFIADAYARNYKTSPGRPNSDGSRARTFLESKGYRFGGDEVLLQRLVHMVDKEKRNELMIIYLEDLSPTGFTAADLGKDGKAADKWEEVSKALLEKAQLGMKISR